MNLQEQTAKILIVDDKHENLVALEALLEDQNCEFFLAYSGEMALKLAMQHEFALMLLDVQMPEMDGFELASILKKNKRTSATPIIFVTALRFQPNDILKGYTKGAFDYLSKPLNPDITQAKVTAFINMYFQKKQIEYMNAKLDASNKELSATNKALEEFANIVAHDVKEPLRTIKNFLNLLHRRNRNIFDKASLEFIELCTDSAARLDILVKSLSKYARLGYKDMEKKPINLGQVVDNVKVGLYVKIQETKAIISVENPLPTILANHSSMNQLFQNIIDNAIKYQKKDKIPIIKIACRQSYENWHISIKDNGIGIPEKDKNNVFKIFQRSYAHQAYEGTGVGLAICKRIVENNGGRIQLESQEGVGTTFFLTFPKLGKDSSK